MYHLKCKCGATAKAKGSYDPETNATEIPNLPDGWDGGDPNCTHDDFEITDEEDDYSEDNYV